MLTFTAVYIVGVAVYLAIILLVDDPGRDPASHTGPRIAVVHAANDLVSTDSGFRIQPDGDFAAMALRNPAMWLVVESDAGRFSFGPVPEPVVRAIEQEALLIQSTRFYVPGIERPLANAFAERRRIGSQDALLVAGGVDPSTISAWDTLGARWSEGILIILARAVVVAVVAMLFALPILSRALRPLATQAASILPQEPTQRLDEKKAPRELLPLVRGFNAGLERLAIELQRRKRFIADAAHELRTPLAVVALRVEALGDDTAKQELRRGVERLGHIVSQMLDAERLSLSGRERSLVDLVGIARDVVADLAPAAIRAGYDLSLEAPDAPTMASGNAHAISRALTNLIDNAIRHGGGEGHICVRVRADRTIDVTDEGPGVPEALQDRLFEPFSRGRQDAEGCGLGLHLTREIMSAHGGKVSLCLSHQGAWFRLEFPEP
ncbi:MULTISPECIES: HAMP domain-containing sensor histidine kinase [unclassified Sphingomonas]|uniref:sensor histidine kinase n=1 Tax=unclassified Sphingomonas TaxID=196159 RepID=UPI0021507914|nr:MULTISPECIES: HAMP domain-containing sensor histidine kinase [unclassified Sphingomonas]MCR5869453.1 HAMP domain-containing histidine kinase [Sphingomonas sp. J344]UUX98816.1 HAMP domain-containing histidine kinase [Sphingomonas sp. J315]